MLFFFLTIGASVCFACGNVISKSGITQLSQKPDIKHPLRFVKAILSNKRWWLGFAIACLASLGNYAAMALYNLSLVKPMTALNPVLTVIFGYVFLKENINKRIIAAIICVIIGILVAAFDVEEKAGTQNIPALWMYTLIMFALAFSTKKFIQKREISDSLIMGIGYGISDAFYKSLAISATEKGISLSGAELLYWITDLRVWGFFAAFSLAFSYTQIAFSHGRALFVIPFSAAIGAAVPILAAAVVFGEPFPPKKIFCVILVLIGSSLFISSQKELHTKGDNHEKN
jgi:EamA domain-containing membrane protein RarD